MKIFAISDLHLSGAREKPMDIFGQAWSGHWDAIRADWQSRVTEEDVVLIAGDISWAMTLEDALVDLREIAALGGTKVILRGNHDYWWQSLTKVRAALGENFFAVQNDCVRVGRALLCGSRLWHFGGTPEDEKIRMRERARLELSLKQAQKQRETGDTVIAMCHYPPFETPAAGTMYTQLFAAYGADAVVYGHLHGRDCRRDATVDGIVYHLTSCDILGNRLLEIAEI